MTWKRFLHYWPFVRGICYTFNIIGPLWEESTTVPQYWPVVRRINWWPVYSPHKGPVMWNFVSLKKLLNRQCSCWWLKLPWSSYAVPVMKFGKQHFPKDVDFLCEIYAVFEILTRKINSWWPNMCSWFIWSYVLQRTVYESSQCVSLEVICQIHNGMGWYKVTFMCGDTVCP